MTPRVQDLSINRSYELVYKTNGKSLTMSSQCQLHAPFTMYTAAPSMYALKLKLSDDNTLSLCAHGNISIRTLTYSYITTLPSH